MAKRKKPLTKRDIHGILRSVISQVDFLTQKLKDIDVVLIDFIQYSSDLKKFEEWLDEKYKSKDEEE